MDEQRLAQIESALDESVERDGDRELWPEEMTCHDCGYSQSAPQPRFEPEDIRALIAEVRRLRAPSPDSADYRSRLGGYD